MRHCKSCNKPFILKSRPSKVYCSKKCLNKFKSTLRPKIIRPIKKCLFCSRSFLVGGTHTEQRFCSEPCRVTARHQADPARYAAQVKAQNEKRKGYQADYRRKNRKRISAQTRRWLDDKVFGGNRIPTLERDSWRCTKCNEGRRSRLVVHHIDESGQSETPNNELSNLQTLCRKCHASTHKLQLLGSNARKI